MRFMTENLLDYEMHVKIEIAQIPGKDNIVPDALVYPQETGPCERIEKERFVHIDYHHLLSFHSFQARALDVDDFATSTSDLR